MLKIYFYAQLHASVNSGIEIIGIAMCNRGHCPLTPQPVGRNVIQNGNRAGRDHQLGHVGHKAVQHESRAGRDY
jgi:hypothetical protein